VLGETVGAAHKKLVVAMKALFSVAALALALTATTAPAEAKGCFKRAFTGAVVGHDRIYIGQHPAMGTVASCHAGHHMAKQHQQQQHKENAPPSSPYPAPPALGP
jgi:hypothetical protein